MDKKNTYFIMLLVIIVCILQQFFPFINNVVQLLAIAIIALSLVVSACLIINFIITKTKIRKVSKEHLHIIDEYYNINKDMSLLSNYNLVLYFEKIDFVIMNFYEMKKKLAVLVKKDLFNKTTDKIISDTQNKEIKRYYELATKAIDVIFQYYDENGTRKI